MKIFGRTGGYYLFWCSFIYLAIGLPCALYYKEIQTEYIQVGWLLMLALPFSVPPIGRYFNLDVTWDRRMFDMFKKKPSNVVPFPKQEEAQHGGGDGGGYIPEAKKPSVTYYTLGMTSENRLEFKMGYSAITMNYGGVVNLIEQLETFKKQLAEYEGVGDHDDNV